MEKGVELQDNGIKELLAVCVLRGGGGGSGDDLGR